MICIQLMMYIQIVKTKQNPNDMCTVHFGIMSQLFASKEVHLRKCNRNFLNGQRVYLFILKKRTLGNAYRLPIHGTRILKINGYELCLDLTGLCKMVQDSSGFFPEYLNKVLLEFIQISHKKSNRLMYCVFAH